MRSVALATDRNHPHLSHDDQLLLPILHEMGFEACPVQWDSQDTDWERFDTCIVRSCWDYHLRISEFLQWSQHLGDRHVRVWNPIEIIRWNHHKRYLKDLEQKGIPIVPTYLVERDSVKSLKDILEVCRWDDVIVKPCVSASSYRTHRISRDAADSYQAEFQAIAQESGALVQPFIREIQESGEWSFVFFNRRFSHAVRKTPAKGEYRSQESFGGSMIQVVPSSSQVRAAENVIASVEGDLLYGRVDMIQVNGQLLLGELELIEPSLFFESDFSSTLRFVQALSRQSVP